MSGKNQAESNDDQDQAQLIGNTNSSEYIIRYNLFNAGEEVAGLFVLQTGHANITLIERSAAGDRMIGGGNLGVNAGGLGADADTYSLSNPFDKKLDGIMGVDTSSWQGVGQASYEQNVTAEQLENVKNYIVSYTGDLYSTVNVNYNVGASVLGLDDQHSCYTFVADVYKATGAEGRLLDQFSKSQLENVDSIIETVHGDIPAIPRKAVEKSKEVSGRAAESVSSAAESAVEKTGRRLGIGSANEDAPEQDAYLIPTGAEYNGQSAFTTENLSVNLSRGAHLNDAALPSGPAPSAHEVLAGAEYDWAKPGHLGDLSGAGGDSGVHVPETGVSSGLGRLMDRARGLFGSDPPGMDLRELSQKLSDASAEINALDRAETGGIRTSPEGWRFGHPETQARWETLERGYADGTLKDMRIEVDLEGPDGATLPPHARADALLDAVDRAAAAVAEDRGRTPKALSGPLADYARDHPVPGSEEFLVARGDPDALARETGREAARETQMGHSRELDLHRGHDVDLGHGLEDAYEMGL